VCKELKKRNHHCVCVNWPDPFKCHISTWKKFIIEDLRCDKNTVLIGHSTGALLAMRLLEMKIPLLGVILVSAAHTDLGDEGERISGYFDEPWDWSAVRENHEQVQFVHQFHSVDDHLIPVSEARFVAAQLKSPKHVYEELRGYSHFFTPFDALLEAVDRYFPPGVVETEEVSSSK